MKKNAPVARSDAFGRDASARVLHPDVLHPDAYARASHPSPGRKAPSASCLQLADFLFSMRPAQALPRVLTRRHVAAATRYGIAALYHYDRAHVTAPCRYVPIGLAMLGLLRAASVVSEAEYLVLLRRLKDLAFEAVVESFPLPKCRK